MAKPNYGFEKRQRELAKKQKKEAKRLKKAAAEPSPSRSPSTSSTNDISPAKGAKDS